MGETVIDDAKTAVACLTTCLAYHRLLHGHQPLTDRFATRVVDIVVAEIERS